METVFADFLPEKWNWSQNLDTLWGISELFLHQVCFFPPPVPSLKKRPADTITSCGQPETIPRALQTPFVEA